MTKTKRLKKADKKNGRAAKRGRAPKPNPAAQALGRLGGLARKKNLTAKRASELGRRAAFARHGKPWPPAEADAAA